MADVIGISTVFADDGDTTRPVAQMAPYDIDYCKCERRPVYEHGLCKACHDSAWYTQRCTKCRLAGRFPRGVPKLTRSKPTPDPALVAKSAHAQVKDRPNGRRTAPRVQSARESLGHPKICHCGFCDPRQPKVIPIARKK
jgi:hypothetical protein